MNEQQQDDREAAFGRKRYPMNVGDFMPDFIASMERQRAKWAAFCDEIRPQFEAAPESRACKHHPSTMRPKLFEETCQKSRMEGEFRPQYAPCPDCKGYEAQERLREFWRKRGLPERVIDATFDTFTADTDGRALARASAMEWIKRNGLFLMLRGTPGTGKGHIAAACLKAQGNGLWLTHAKMLAEMRESYSLHTTQFVLSVWQECECLVIDELGVSPGGKDEEAMFYQVISERYDKRRATIFTTNKTSDDYKAVLGYRLVDRITEDCTTIVFSWESWRAKK